MGFQNKNDNSGMEKNTSTQASSSQKTSNVSKLAKNTTQVQYGRLNLSNSVDTRYDDNESYKCSPKTVDNQQDLMSSIRRTSCINSLVKAQVSGSDDRLKGSGKPVGTGE